MRKNSIYLLTVLLLTMLFSGCQGMPSSMPFNLPGSSEEATPTVEVDEPVELVDGEVSVEGRLVPKESVWLSFPSAGIIEEVFAEEGDTIKKGDILARLTGDEQLASVIAAAEFELFAAQQARETLRCPHVARIDDVEAAVARVLHQLRRRPHPVPQQPVRRIHLGLL